jgi:hypothetical protein
MSNDTTESCDYLAMLASQFPKSTATDTSIAAANTVIEHWGPESFTKITTTDDVIKDPTAIFYAYAADIIAANKLTAENFQVGLSNYDLNHAFANLTSNGDKIVHIYEKFNAFINEFMITVAVCAFSDPQPAKTEFYYQVLAIATEEYVENKLSSSAFAGKFIEIASYDYTLTEIGAFVASSIFAFVVCHEIAHHQLKHYGSNKADTGQALIEIEADRCGYDLYLKTLYNSRQNTHLKLNEQLIHTPVLLFEILQSINQVSTKNAIDNFRTQHLTKRKQHLLDHIDAKQTMSDRDIYHGMLACCRQYLLSQCPT